MVEFLLERGTAPGALSCEHLTALDFALMNGHEECVMPMLEKGTRSKLETFLNKAVRFGHSGIVWLLLEKGMDVDIKGLDGRTVLQNALMGDRKCLPVLIDHGTCARPEILLHIAMMSGDMSLLQPLQLGANPTFKHGGKNAYYEALVYKDHHVLKGLLKSRVGAEGRTFDRRAHANGPRTPRSPNVSGAVGPAIRMDDYGLVVSASHNHSQIGSLCLRYRAGG